MKWPRHSRAKEENDMIKGCKRNNKEYQQVRVNDNSEVSTITRPCKAKVLVTEQLSQAA